MFGPEHSVIDPNTGCWNWTLTCFSNGYPAKKHDGKMHRAHRLQWAFVHGDIPEGMQVLHTCDNPKCINPDHLRLGTQYDNIQDMIAKGRNNFMGRLGRGSTWHLRGAPYGSA